MFVGDICFIGVYCFLGSFLFIYCQVGYYFNSIGNDDISDCKQCIFGYYCDGSGNVIFDGFCFQGYYCFGGQDFVIFVGYNCI